MQFCNTRFAIVLFGCLGVAFGSWGCAKDAVEVPPPSSRSVAASYIESALTGSWVEIACNEGDSGPDLPPPPYFKGTVKFGDHLVRLSSRVFDDKDCATPRQGTIDETIVHYSLPEHFDTTDGSVAVNLQFPEQDGYLGYTMYGLIKIEGATLKMALFNSEARRPKSMDRVAAQVFAPMP